MTKTFKLYWIREDQQCDFDMGVYATRADAKAAIPYAKSELIDRCGEDQIAEIEAGTWQIIEIEAA